MTSAAIKVLDAGPGVSVQDYGRPGYQRFGVTEGGAMDRWALAEANLLLGNPPDTAAIEMIAMGGSFTVTGQPLKMATSGAAMEVKVDGLSIPWRSSFVVLPGQIIHCGYARGSIYSYLQCGQGLVLTPVMGSHSTHSRSGFGGFNGRTLEAGDELPVLNSHQLNYTPETLPTPDYLARDSIRVVWGTQADVFSKQVRHALLQSEFTVSAERDRMGARLSTAAGSLAAESGLSGVSDAVLIGDIQVAGDGVATVLLADRQPTGGYPRIATVITADVDAISQMPTGKSFRFELVTLDQAVDAIRQRRSDLESLPALLSPITRQPEDIPDLLSYNLIDGMVNGQ